MSTEVKRWTELIKPRWVRNLLTKHKALQLDGPELDRAILGIVFLDTVKQGQPLLLYSVKKLIRALTASDMSYDDAVEYMDFNIIGAWVGAGTPMYLYRASKHGDNGPGHMGRGYRCGQPEYSVYNHQEYCDALVARNRAIDQNDAMRVVDVHKSVLGPTKQPTAWFVPGDLLV